MTRWFFLFFLALILIISFRLVTFSSAPINTVACDSVSIESDLSGIWDLNRIDNFSGFKPYLIKADLENYSFLINYLMPFFLSNSQILIVDICEEKMLLSYNYFREWRQYAIPLLSNKKIRSNNEGQDVIAVYGQDSLEMNISIKNIDFKQELYLDGGELIREIEFQGSSSGKIKFIYRKND